MAFILGPLQQKWLAALKSGNYIHTKYELARSDDGGNLWKHCCIGVGCEIIDMPYNINKLNNNFKLGKSFEGDDAFSEKFAESIKLFKRIPNISGFSDRINVQSNDKEWLAFCKLFDISNMGLQNITYINDGSSSYDPIIWLIENKPEWIFTESA